MKKDFRSILLVVLVIVLTTSFAMAAAPKKVEERWYGTYYEGKKRGSSHAEFVDEEKGGVTTRTCKSETYLNVRSAKTTSNPKKSVTKQYTFHLKASHEVRLENDRIVFIKAKRTSTRQPILRAKSRFENGVLTIERTEGVVDADLTIKAGDYDLTSDPDQIEPFLETVTSESVKKKVFIFSDAEIRDQTFVRKDDGKTTDETGAKKPAKVYKATDEDGTTTYKTIHGTIVYVKRVDAESDTVIVWKRMDKKRAKSDTGY